MTRRAATRGVATLLDVNNFWTEGVTADGFAFTVNRDAPGEWVVRDENGQPTHPEPFPTRAAALDAIDRGDA